MGAFLPGRAISSIFHLRHGFWTAISAGMGCDLQPVLQKDVLRQTTNQIYKMYTDRTTAMYWPYDLKRIQGKFYWRLLCWRHVERVPRTPIWCQELQKNQSLVPNSPWKRKVISNKPQKWNIVINRRWCYNY